MARSSSPVVFYTVLISTFVIGVLCSSNSTEGPLVQLPVGSVRGLRQSVLNRSVEAFLGIPYAQPPTAELRFEKPLAADPWTEVYEATSKKLGCPQANQFIARHVQLLYANHTSENCLAVNVWRPAASQASKSLKPVFVFIYGGGFQWGSSDVFLYDGRTFAALNDVIFVSFNYRVGVFGFLHHAEIPELTGTMGLWDQNLALQWIKENIEYFGGNPDEITLCGHSAGAISAAIHAISPHANGLFRRVILQSGTSLSLTPLSRLPRQDLESIAKSVNCHGTPQEQLECLRKVRASRLVAEVDAMGHEGLAFPPFESDYASLSAEFLSTAEFNAAEMIIGTTEDEANTFVRRILDSNQNLKDLLSDVGHHTSLTIMLQRAFRIPLADARTIVSEYFSEDGEYTSEAATDIVAQAATDLFFACPAQFYSEVAASKGVAVYRYLFRHRPSFTLFEDIPGVLHGDELAFTLGNLLTFRDLLKDDVITTAREEFLKLNHTEDEEQLMWNILGMWRSFAQTGHPTLPPDHRAWPRFTASRDAYIEIQKNIRVGREHPSTDRCHIWEKLLMERTPSPRRESEEDENALEEKSDHQTSTAANSPTIDLWIYAVPTFVLVFVFLQMHNPRIN